MNGANDGPTRAEDPGRFIQIVNRIKEHNNRISSVCADLGLVNDKLLGQIPHEGKGDEDATACTTESILALFSRVLDEASLIIGSLEEESKRLNSLF